MSSTAVGAGFQLTVPLSRAPYQADGLLQPGRVHQRAPNPGALLALHTRRTGRSYPEPVDLEFSGEIWFWKGPAPWHFITVPDEECSAIAAMSAMVSYGWGVIPVRAGIGRTRWSTSLFPKDGAYLVPVKVGVRRAEGLELGDTVTIRLAIAP